MDINGKKVNIHAIIDSGNLLKDPITGASVIVVERAKLEEIGKNIIHNGKYAVITMAGGQGTRLGHSGPKEEYISKFRVIPFSSLGKQNGMLIGFKPDFAEVEIDGINRKLENIVIGIYEKSITKNHEYTGLVGLDILEEGGSLENEYIRNIKA